MAATEDRQAARSGQSCAGSGGFLSDSPCLLTAKREPFTDVPSVRTHTSGARFSLFLSSGNMKAEHY